MIKELYGKFFDCGKIKSLQYHKKIANSFWRTTQQQEIDYVEESNGSITGYEFKWKTDGRVKIPQAFKETYEATGTVISKENFRSFLAS